MNDLVKSLLEGLIEVNEFTNKKIVGMFGGGFKPPTSGHLEVVKRALEENPEMDELIVLVGSGVRDSISQEESLAIWSMYKKYLPGKVTVMASPKDKPPIGAIYSYARKNPNEIVYFFVGAREGNEEDFQDIEKRTRSLRKLPYQNVKVKQIITGGSVSGTKARQALLANDKETFLQFIPDIPEADEIWNMLTNVVKERISFSSDFITQGDVEFVDDLADKKLSPIDIDLTGNHFFDRLNDPRNFPDISVDELEEFFDKLSDEKEKFIEFLRKYKDVVVKDTESNLNIPFMKRANKAIAKTIMRKKNFMTSNQVLPLDEKNDKIEEISINLSNYSGQVLPGDVLRAPKGFPLGGKKLEKSKIVKVIKNSREGVNRYKLTVEDQDGKQYTVRNFEMDGEYKGKKLPKFALVRKSKKNLQERDPKKGTGKKPKGSGRRLYTDEDPSDTVKVKFSTRQDIVNTLNKKSFKAKSHARQSQIINLIHQRVRAALSRTKDPKKKKRLQTAFNYIKKRKEASKAKTKRLQAQKKKKKANEIKGGFSKGNVGTRYRAIYKKGDKFYYDQDDTLGQGIRQTFGPFKTKADAKKKMQSFTPAINYRDITENIDPKAQKEYGGKSAPFGSAYKPVKENFTDEDLMPLIISLTQYMGSNGLNLKPYPKLKFIDNNKENAKVILGRTAYYDPNQQLIALYTMDRHPKDILRSYAHELVHHHQNLNNTLDHSQTTNTNADNNLNRIEREAYETGNILFRNWEDSIKNL